MTPDLPGNFFRKKSAENPNQKGQTHYEHKQPNEWKHHAHVFKG
jgi:hypothetical protein